MRFDMLSAKLRILQPVCRELQHLRTGALGRVLHELACSTMSLAPAEHAFCTRSHGKDYPALPMTKAVVT
jgi:hypothetical protein